MESEIKKLDEEEAQKKVEALEAASLAGEILLASGAEIFRVEETIARIAAAYHLESNDTFVLSSGIFMTAKSRNGHFYASVKHIPLSGSRLDRVTEVNQLSREIAAGIHTAKEARQKLEEIKMRPGKCKSHQILASAVGSASFCYLFGGNLHDSMAAFLCGLILYLYLLYVVQGRLSKIITNLSGGALVTVLAILLYHIGFGDQMNYIIIGSIIPLVPGVAFTNAIRDIADEDYIAGAVRMLDVLLVSFCIAMGVGIVTQAYYYLIGGSIL